MANSKLWSALHNAIRTPLQSLRQRLSARRSEAQAPPDRTPPSLVPPARKRPKRAHRAGTIYQKIDRTIIQVRDIDGRRKTRSFPDAESARIALAKATSNVAQGLPANIDRPPRPRPPATLNEHASPWLAGRVSNKSHYQDVSRWRNHWAPIIGAMTPNEVTVGVLKQAFRTLREKGLSNSTIRLCARLLSPFYGDLVEEGHAKDNPVRLLSPKTRREFLKPAYDPKKTPFMRDSNDIVRIYRRILDSNTGVAVAYGIGALAGLRPAEIGALDWSAIDMNRRTITVARQVQNRRGRPVEFHTKDGTTHVKDGEVRIVPLSDSLHPILLEQKARTGGIGLVCPPGGRGRVATIPGRFRFLNTHTMGKYLKLALAALGIQNMNFYQATRHTFASQWVLDGGTLEKLQAMMGHSSIVVTERYAHLMPGRFTDEDRSRIAIQMVEEPGAKVLADASATCLNGHGDVD